MTKEKRIQETALKLKLNLQTMLIKASGGKAAVSGKYRYFGANDLADIIKYCDFVLDGDYKKAYKLQNNMDTPVYELLPYVLYDFVRGN